MIVLDQIRKRYGRVQASNGVSLTLEPGRIYALVGENGAGKSTLMRILAGHTRPDSGLITIHSERHAALSPSDSARLGVGMLYQDPLDFPALPVWENFRIGGKPRPRKDVLTTLETLAARLGIFFHPSDRMSSMTVGERQVLELLRLLDLGATTLILDEPTTGITPEQKTHLFGLLSRLAKQDHHTVILVTHKLSEALELADTIFVLRQGRLVAELEPPYDSDVLVRLMFGQAVPPAPRLQAVTNAPRLVMDKAVFSGDKYPLGPLTLRAAPGEIIGLAGLDGSGQEVFLRGLSGLHRLHEGSITLDGRPFPSEGFPALRRQGVHFVPADRMAQGLFPELSIREHLALAFPRESAASETFLTTRCVEQFNLRAHPDTLANALSGGNQQRLLLSLMPDQIALLLMEHPTRGLDAESAAQVWSHLHARCVRGTTLFFFSPDLDEVLEHSHRVLVFFNRALAVDLPRSEANVKTVGAFMAGNLQEDSHAG